MSDRDSCQAPSHGPVRGLLVALGVLWSPTIPKRRRISPRLLLPGHRRNGGARRRGRRSAQQTWPGASARLQSHDFAAIAACP
jgi:hypothetical protein